MGFTKRQGQQQYGKRKKEKVDLEERPERLTLRRVLYGSRRQGRLGPGKEELINLVQRKQADLANSLISRNKEKDSGTMVF